MLGVVCVGLSDLALSLCHVWTQAPPPARPALLAPTLVQLVSSLTRRTFRDGTFQCEPEWRGPERWISLRGGAKKDQSKYR
jgi:hypothetical protein